MTLLFLCCILMSVNCNAQTPKVQTLIANVNASGGITSDKNGNIYLSDYGPSLARGEVLTNVYKYDLRQGTVSVFATGFKGASGSCFDKDGNFYQSNAFGNTISRVSIDGNVDHNWYKGNLKIPVGLVSDEEKNIYVCNCGSNNIGVINQNKEYEVYAISDNFKCPNGLTKDNNGNLYACNFNDGKILKIDKNREVTVIAELPVLKGGASLVGNGHLIWKNDALYVTTIGTGAIYKVTMDGKVEIIAGKPYSFKNEDGIASEASFSKPNGITASKTGDTLYINVSDPTWIKNPQRLHPAHLRIITGIRSDKKDN